MLRQGNAPATEQIGLILPTSMCAAQIARLAANRLNQSGAGRGSGIDRYVSLAHSEGCGFGGETMYRLLHRTYRGYATHPNVAAALLLEHGCEKIPNDAMRRQFELAALPLDRFGWASVQLDGGIERTLGTIDAWFTEASRRRGNPSVSRSPGPLALGLLSAGTLSPESAEVFAVLANRILAGGGSVLLPESDGLVGSPIFRERVMPGIKPRPTLAYGEPLQVAGLHLVDTETDHWVENLTGIGACGVHAFVGLVGESPQQGHPLLPLIQVADLNRRGEIAQRDVDLFLSGEAAQDGEDLWSLLSDVITGAKIPVAGAGGFVDFQLARGLLGVST